MTTTATQRTDEDDEVIRFCNEILGLLKQTCGKHLNADGTVWCAAPAGHTGACRGLTVTL